MKRFPKMFSLLLLLGLLCLCSCGKKELASGELEGSPYPCSWKQKNNGDFVITIDGDLPENAQWSVQSSSGVLEVTAEKTPGKFTVSPLSEGSGWVLLELREGGLPVEKGVDFSFGFFVEKGQGMSLSHASARELEADACSGVSGASVYWRAGSDVSLFLHFSGSSWTVMESKGIVCMGPTPEEASARMEVVPIQDAAEYSLLMRSNETQEQFLFCFELVNGALSVRECSSESPAEAES